jgi:hypothetical protein
MVNVVKMPDKKKVHLLRVDSKEFGVDLLHTGLSVYAQQLLKSRNSIAQVLYWNFRTFFKNGAPTICVNPSCEIWTGAAQGVWCLYTTPAFPLRISSKVYCSSSKSKHWKEIRDSPLSRSARAWHPVLEPGFPPESIMMVSSTSYPGSSHIIPLFC